MNLHIVIGTPMYGGMCSSEYVQSINALTTSLTKSGFESSTIFLGNESLIQRGRNTIAWHFLNNPQATHLLFVDADIKFRVEDIARMVQSDKPIITAPVCMKAINWGNITDAIKNGREDPWNFTGFYNINYLKDHKPKVDEPFQIRHGGCGIMLIQRKVFEELTDKVPQYVNDMYNSTEIMNNPMYIKEFFDTSIDEETGRLFSEDYHFCMIARKQGMKVYAAPWVHLAHMGSYLFEGRLLENAE